MCPYTLEGVLISEGVMYRLPHIRGSICIVLSFTDGALTFCSFSSFLCSSLSCSLSLATWTSCDSSTDNLLHSKHSHANYFQSRSMERNNHISDFESKRNRKTSIHVVCNMPCCIQVYTCTHVHEIVACTGWDSKPHLQSSSLAHYELSYRGSSVLDGQNPRQRFIIGKATLKTLLCTILASAFPLHTHARLIFPCRCVKGEDLGTRLVQSYYCTDALKHTEGLEIVFSSLPPVSLVPIEAYQSLQP